MRIAQKAVLILIEAETRLRQLTGEAIEGGDYLTTIKLAELAKTINAMISSIENHEKCRITQVPYNDPSLSIVPMRTSAITKTSRRRLQKSKVGSSYPKFLKTPDQLVKIGWSKQEKSEYHHKAPREVVDLVVRSLAQKYVSGKLLATQDLMPLHNPDDGSEIPSYQVYLCLAWLRQIGLISPVGRQGYVMANPGEIEKDVRNRWDQIPSL